MGKNTYNNGSEDNTNLINDSISKENSESDINWERTFETLGGQFTIKILLGRERFDEVFAWLEDPMNERNHELPLILTDCKSARSEMERSGASEESLYSMNQIIDRVSTLSTAA